MTQDVNAEDSTVQEKRIRTKETLHASAMIKDERATL
jgi:hypothetical protein